MQDDQEGYQHYRVRREFKVTKAFMSGHGVSMEQADFVNSNCLPDYQQAQPGQSPVNISMGKWFF